MIPWRAVNAGGWVLLLTGLGLMVFGPFWVGLGLFAGGAALGLRAAAVPRHFPQHSEDGGDWRLALDIAARKIRDRRGLDDDQ